MSQKRAKEIAIKLYDDQNWVTLIIWCLRFGINLIILIRELKQRKNHVDTPRKQAEDEPERNTKPAEEGITWL